jgi:hypothetical protein
MTRSTSSHRMQPREKLIAFGFGLVALLALANAAAWAEVRAPLLALGIAAVAQLPVWTAAPMSSSGKPPRTLVALEGGLAVGSVVASLSASAWFAVPAVITVMTTTGLVWARRVGPTTSPREAASDAPAEAPPPASTSVEELRALQPRLRRFEVAFMTFFLILASLCVLAAAAQPLMLVGAAVCAGIAGSVRIGEWLSAKTMPPSHRRELERRLHKREAGRQAGEPNGKSAG